MNNNIAYEEKPDAILVHSKNIAVLEQTSFVLDYRTMVLICSSDIGYAAVGKRAPTGDYLTLGRWQIDESSAVTFHVPNSQSMSIQQVSLESLLARYQSEIDLWVTVCGETRHHVKHLVTR